MSVRNTEYSLKYVIFKTGIYFNFLNISSEIFSVDICKGLWQVENLKVFKFYSLPTTV